MAASTRVRRQKAAASRRAAKEKRERILIIGLGVVLVGILALELPKVLKSSGGSSSSTTPVTSVPVATTPAAATASNPKALRKALKQAPHDVFATRGAGSASTIGSVPVPAGLHDPFAKPGSAAATVAPPAAKPVVTPTLPGTIIIGTPGKGRVAVKGWIVILASIPTKEGEAVAKSFAASARKGSIGTVSILNSSNRRPLRGGYWVVYVGPYNTLGGVATAAGHIHSSGYGTAYIRELIVYKKKT